MVNFAKKETLQDHVRMLNIKDRISLTKSYKKGNKKGNKNIIHPFVAFIFPIAKLFISI